MQYLLHDLIKLPLSERLSIVEQVISTIEHTDYEQALCDLLKEKLVHIQPQENNATPPGEIKPFQSAKSPASDWKEWE